ncbi:MAG TPA: pilus assembly protein CpaE [Microbacterium sp.]|uniref:pilus assembly protein CpaE n=1 Tax=Microbacterium sp. TaxID=51671 RepID=UPI002D05706A|nr:pilus assembly protein CpaE [Microbacterium sp.]HWI30971.1 pilus assembly protein CpaE [Microbacterium sp.]
MISRELAAALKAEGLVWHPASGDRFTLDLPGQNEIEDDVFTVSEMTIEPYKYPTGTILGFNGTTEWALDSVGIEQTIWLPREDQLRELLRGSFRSLTRVGDAFVVEIAWSERMLSPGDPLTQTFEHPEPAEAYGLAVRELIRRSR